MRSDHQVRNTVFLLVAYLQVSAATASEVFTWEDAEGVTHYSQWAPDDVAEVSTLIVHNRNAPGYEPQEDPYSITNQARRMNETWKTLEAKKKQRQEEKQEALRRAPLPAQPRYERSAYYAPPWFYRPVYPPVHRPEPPIYRPPHVRPGQPRPSLPSPGFAPDPMRSAHIGVRKGTRSVPAVTTR